jgi:hypothetical protein
MIDTVFVFPDTRATGLQNGPVSGWFQLKISCDNHTAIGLGRHTGRLSAFLARHLNMDRAGIGPSLCVVFKHLTRLLVLFASLFLVL